MSCPERTLVTKVRGHPSGNRREPTRGGSGSFHCGGGGMLPRPAASSRATTLAFLVGRPGVTSPSHEGSPPSSGVHFLSRLLSCSQPHSHRCHVSSTSVTRTPERVVSQVFACWSSHSTPALSWPGMLIYLAPSPAFSKCVRPSVSVGHCVCLRLSLQEAVRTCLSPRASSVRLPVPVGVCSAAEALSVVSVSACLSSVVVCHWSPSEPRGLWVWARREGEGGEVAAGGGGEGRGRRQGAGAGAGGGAERPGGGVCGGPEAAAVRVGSACAGEHRPPPAPGVARPGPARPPQVSLPPHPGPPPPPLRAEVHPAVRVR